MCDILHLRHTKVWLRPDWLFNLTKYGKNQIKLLEIIHGLTKKVIQAKKEEYKSGKRNVIDNSAQKTESKVRIKQIFIYIQYLIFILYFYSMIIFILK